jgi:hypothetical protein
VTTLLLWAAESSAPAPFSLLLSYDHSSVLFTALLQLATLDGAWNLTEQLLQIVKHSVQTTKQSTAVITAVEFLTTQSLTDLASNLPLPPTALSTLLGLWALQTGVADRQPEWMVPGIGGQAKGCRRGQLGGPADRIDTITSQIISAAAESLRRMKACIAISRASAAACRTGKLIQLKSLARNTCIQHVPVQIFQSH